MALTKEHVEQMVKQYGIHGQDSGSTDVQIALLTERIASLTTHMQKNNKDFASRRGLLKMVAQRKKLLTYLQRENLQRYNAIKKKLELK